MEMRRRVAAELKPGSVEIPRDAGFAICDGGRFPDIPSVVSNAQHVLATVNLEKLKARANKRFMMKLLDQKLVTLDSPFMRLALHPEVVAAATRYLGVVPILQFVSVYYSSETNEDLSKSQLYHCDSDDTEQVKVWVLCNEVTPETGPLTLLPAAQSDLVRKKVGYTYDMLLTDEQVSADTRRASGAASIPRTDGDGRILRHQPVPALRQPLPRSDEDASDRDAAVHHATVLHLADGILGTCAVPGVWNRPGPE